MFYFIFKSFNSLKEWITLALLILKLFSYLAVWKLTDLIPCKIEKKNYSLLLLKSKEFMHLLNVFVNHTVYFMTCWTAFFKEWHITVTFSEIDSCFLKIILFNPCLQLIKLNACESRAAFPIVNKLIYFWQRVHKAAFLFLLLAIHNLYYLLVNHSSWNTMQLFFFAIYHSLHFFSWK